MGGGSPLGDGRCYKATTSCDVLEVCSTKEHMLKKVKHMQKTKVLFFELKDVNPRNVRN